MKLKIVIHDAEEGGYWAEVPSIAGCATQGETFEELLDNIYEAIEGCLSVDVNAIEVIFEVKPNTSERCQRRSWVSLSLERI